MTNQTNDARQFGRDTQSVQPAPEVAVIPTTETIYCRDCRHWNHGQPVSPKANMAPCQISMLGSMLAAYQNTTDMTTCSKAEPR